MDKKLPIIGFYSIWEPWNELESLLQHFYTAEGKTKLSFGHFLLFLWFERGLDGAALLVLWNSLDFGGVFFSITVSENTME